MPTACGPKMPKKVVSRLKVADMTFKRKEHCSCFCASTRPTTNLSVFTPDLNPTHREGLKWQGERGIIFKKAPLGKCSTILESQSPLHLSEHAHNVTSCLWFGCWYQKWICWFWGWGGGSRCNVRVLFVSFLFFMFLSFCIIPFLFCVCFLLSLWHLLFIVKMMMMMMCPSVSPPGGKYVCEGRRGIQVDEV